MSNPDFVHAWVLETGERVYIPRSHLKIFEGAFTLEDPHGVAAATKTKPAVAATKNEKEVS